MYTTGNRITPIPSGLCHPERGFGISSFVGRFRRPPRSVAGFVYRHRYSVKSSWFPLYPLCHSERSDSEVKNLLYFRTFEILHPDRKSGRRMTKEKVSPFHKGGVRGIFAFSPFELIVCKANLWFWKNHRFLKKALPYTFFCALFFYAPNCPLSQSPISPFDKGGLRGIFCLQLPPIAPNNHFITIPLFPPLEKGDGRGIFCLQLPPIAPNNHFITIPLFPPLEKGE